MDRLRATAYLDILNDISAEDRIAYGRLSPDDAPADDDATRRPARRPTAPDAPDAGRSGRVRLPLRRVRRPVRAARRQPLPRRRRTRRRRTRRRRTGRRQRQRRPARLRRATRPGGTQDPAPRAAVARAATWPPPGGHGGPDPGRGPDDLHPGDARPEEASGDDTRTAPPAPRSPFLRPPDGPPPTLTDLVFPLATLLGLAERPGEGHPLGTLDPALCRALAALQPPCKGIRLRAWDPPTTRADAPARATPGPEAANATGSSSRGAGASPSRNQAGTSGPPPAAAPTPKDPSNTQSKQAPGSRQRQS